MLQLILHGIGDFFVQTDEWALNKKKKGWYGLRCYLLHCITYSLPFKFIGSWLAVSVIFLTHFAIDRTNIVAYALAWKNGVRKVESKVSEDRKTLTVWYTTLDISNFGFGLERPFPITIWLFIICDNLCHIICNYVSLKYL